MKNIRYALLALAAIVLALLPEAAPAQTVTQQPQFVNNAAIDDFGNGPLEFKVLLGSAQLFTSSGSGVGSTSGASTTLTLTATPAVAPCVGCLISGAGITSGTTVAAFNGTTTVTLSAAMTVAASTPLAWGAACPVSIPAAGSVSPALIQAGVGGDLPFYTQARLCGTAQYTNGAQVLTFPIGAH